MQQLPRLFSDKGELLPDVDTSMMDEPTLGRLEAIRTADQANKEAQQNLDAAFVEVSAAIEGVQNTTSFFNAHFKRDTFHDLWLSTFGPKTRGQ